MKVLDWVHSGWRQAQWISAYFRQDEEGNAGIIKWDPFLGGSNNAKLGGGFKHLLFSSLFGEMIQFD